MGQTVVGFSPNVQEILDSFEFRNQIPRLSKADALGSLIEKFLDPRINLSPQAVGSGASEQPGLDNHGMGGDSSDASRCNPLARTLRIEGRRAVAKRPELPQSDPAAQA
jgi:hypothetical protein